MKKQDKRIFEKAYFNGWYKKNVGNFTDRDLLIAKKWFWSWLNFINKFVPLDKGYGKSILEIGCSIGAVADLLSERGFLVSASDISRYAVNRAKVILPKIRFYNFDVQNKIPLEQKFDYIISFEVMEHLKNPKKAIKNIFNSLKFKGVVIFTSPYPYSWMHRDPTHINMKYPSQWLAIMKECGFKNVRYKYFSLLPFFYKIHKKLQIVLPFHIPIPLYNNHVLFLGEKS